MQCIVLIPSVIVELHTNNIRRLHRVCQTSSKAPNQLLVIDYRLQYWKNIIIYVQSKVMFYETVLESYFVHSFCSTNCHIVRPSPLIYTTYMITWFMITPSWPLSLWNYDTENHTENFCNAEKIQKPHWKILTKEITVIIQDYLTEIFSFVVQGQWNHTEKI